ncbi:hypothetical protein MP228_002742 [Amoeboaphelidium protococcarum]|nr:hypothetical protein MP228_002742 [Amoeboaphelidium protococcarum]
MLIGRELELEFLNSYLNSEYPVPLLYVYGGYSSGKTTLLKNFVSQVDKQVVAYVDCTLVAHDCTAILRTILRVLESDSSPKNIVDFTHILSKLNKSVIIILDNAHELQDCIDFVASLLKVNDYLVSIGSESQLGTVMASHLNWEAFGLCGFLDPQILYLQEYSQKECIEIVLQSSFEQSFKLAQRFHPLQKTLKEKILYTKLYESLARVVYDALKSKSVKVTDISYVTQSLFPVYVAPLFNELDGNYNQQQNYKDLIENPESDQEYSLVVRKLLNHLKDHLRDDIINLYMRQVSQANFLRRVLLKENVSIHDQTARRLTDLPSLAKLILIASYLASYNPSKFDSKVFGSRQVQGRNGQKSLRLQNKNMNKFASVHTGPKTFEVDRMLGIFENIISDSAAQYADKNAIQIHSQIQSLIALKLLNKCSSTMDRSLECLRLKVNISLPSIKQVSKSVDFDVEKYIYDLHK